MAKVEKGQSLDQNRVITGIVTDPGGAVIPGAKITLISTTTKDKLTTLTTDTVTVGILLSDPTPIDSNGTMSLNGDLIRRLRH